MTSTAAEPAPLWGLVLAGGRSTRMGRDKAMLTLNGITLVERAYRLLASNLDTVFVSCRADQDKLPDLPRISDEREDQGPLGGILSAIARQPAAAWLVVACDMPGLDAAAINQLIEQRDPTAPATAYRSPHDGKPEPLCAIYEPGIRDALLQQHHSGKQSPRDALLCSDVHLVDHTHPQLLENVNTPEELEALKKELES